MISDKYDEILRSMGFEIQKIILRLVDDGLLITDLYLAAVILCCVDNTSCEFVRRSEHNPHQYYFFIRGNPNNIREFLVSYMSGGSKAKDVLVPKVESLRQFVNKVTYLKGLLDKARIKVE